MIPLFGFFEPVKVVLQSGIRFPRRAINTLKLRTVLVSSPVGGGHLGEAEVSEPSRGRNVRATAEVHESLVVPIGADHAIARTFRGVNPRDDLHLVRLVSKEGETFVDAVLLPAERLIVGDDLPHAVFDPGQIVLAEMGPTGQLEVVVEAVLDRRSNGVFGPRPEIGYGLGHHVRCRVTKNEPALRAVGGDDGN